MRFFTHSSPEQLEGDGGKPVIEVYAQPRAGRPIGRAYVCGEDESGDTQWSLRIGGRWLGSLWIVVHRELRPTK